jgi:hypothetical protein
MNGFSGRFQKIMDNGPIGSYIHTGIKRLPGRIWIWFFTSLNEYWTLIGHKGSTDASCYDDN